MSDLDSPKGSLPSIQSFMDPNADPLLSRIFRKLHFDYNSNLVKGKENIEIVQNVAEYLKKHPRATIYVEGHCDKRGPEAYNLALGSRRSNEVKSLLIKEGVEPERILTVSYGKEHLLAIGNDEPAHKQNRRAEFKIYEK
jgi:peptidoglycan-associated lipoprotein